MRANPYASAYKTAKTVDNSNPREVEGRALLEAARKLMLAHSNPEDRSMADDAIDFNWQLWTIFQTEAVQPDSPLPMDIRMTILELCRFIDKRVIKFFANRQENHDLLKVFADLNQTIAAGLFEKK